MKKVLAFDIGGTNMRAALINEKFEIEKVIIEDTKKDSIDTFFNHAAELVEKIGLTNDVVSISCGVPGKVRWDGFIYELPNIGIKNIPLGEFLNSKFGKTTYVKNDAEMAALGEATVGAGEKYDTVFFITISTGVGGALVRNKMGLVPDDEIGHTLVHYNNQYYEFEKLFSGTGIVKLAELNGLKLEKSYELFIKKEEGDPLAKKVFDIWLNGIAGLIKFVNESFQTDIIVMSGGVLKSSKYFFEELKEACKGINIQIAKNEQNAGLMGSAYYGFNPQ